MIRCLKSLAQAACLVIACYTGSTLAAPAPEIDTRTLSPAACKAVAEIVLILQLQKATPFCSSFLSIPLKTSTTVSTTSTTLPAVTSVITSTVTVPGTATTSETTEATAYSTPPAVTVTPAETTSTSVTTTISTQTSTVFVQGYVPPAKAKERDVEARGGLPGWLAAFESKAVSSACSCLTIPTATTTVHSTSTVHVSPTVTSTASSSVTSTSTLTVFVTTTSTDVLLAATLTATTPSTVVTSTSSSVTVTYTTIDPCATQNVVAYACGSFGADVTLQFAFGSYTPQDCCNLCYFSPQHLNCNAWEFESDDSSVNTCTFWTTEGSPVAGSPPQCPLGVHPNQFGCQSAPGQAYYDIENYGYQANGPCGR